MEIESARSIRLGKKVTDNLGRKDYEKWSWEGWSKIGASLLTSPLDGIGFIRDNEWRTIVVTYLGQADPNHYNLTSMVQILPRLVFLLEDVEASTIVFSLWHSL